MKNKLLILILAICLCFGLASCTDDEEQGQEQDHLNDQIQSDAGGGGGGGGFGDDCPHRETVWIDVTDADCITPGESREECAECGKLMNVSVTDALGHEFKNDKCTRCGKSYSTGLIFVSYGDGNCYVDGRGKCFDTEVIIPPTSPDGDRVVFINDGVFRASAVRYVELPKTVERIGNGCFEECPDLVSVNLGGVKYINDYAFNGCSALRSVDLSGVINVGYAAFNKCEALVTLNITGSVCDIGDYAFEGCISLNKVTWECGDGELIVGSGAFLGCEKLTEITIPDSLILLGTSAFCGCRRLRSAHIGGNAIIGDYTFVECPSLETIGFGDTREIGYAAFTECDSLKSISLPQTLTYIGDYAFNECKNLSEINWGGETALRLGDKVFSDCYSLTEVEIPDNVYMIGVGTFAYCTSLTRVKIGKKLQYISDYTFDNCSYLNEVEFGESVIEIGYQAFDRCYSITSLTLNDGLTRINDYAFADCEGLVLIVLPESLEYIDTNAFSGCESLDRVYYKGLPWQGVLVSRFDDAELLGSPFCYSEQKPEENGNFWHYDEAGRVKIWDLSYVAMRADIYSDSFVENCAMGESLASQMKSIIRSEYFGTIRSWEVMHLLSDPLSIFDPENPSIHKSNLYLYVLHDLLMGERASDSLFSLIEDSSYNLMVDMAKPFFESDKAYGKVPVKDLQKVLGIKTVTEFRGAVKNYLTPNMLEQFDMVTKWASNAYEAAEAFSRYYALRQLKTGYIETLRIISEDVSQDKDMREAASKLIDSYEKSLETSLGKFQTGIFVGKTITDILLDVQDESLKLLIRLDATGFLPYYASIIIAELKITTALIDAHGVDDIVNAYYKLTASVAIEKAMLQVLTTYDMDYLKVENLDDAIIYMDAVELYQKSIMLGNEYAQIFFVTYRDTGATHSDIDEVNSLIDSITNSSKMKQDVFSDYEARAWDRFTEYYLKA